MEHAVFTRLVFDRLAENFLDIRTPRFQRLYAVPISGQRGLRKNHERGEGYDASGNHAPRMIA
jgi:hypothetical protein